MTSPRFFSGGHTGDFRQALMYIAHRYPRSTLLGLGFSAGATTMTKYLAEEGKSSRLSAACAISCVGSYLSTFWPPIHIMPLAMGSSGE